MQYRKEIDGLRAVAVVPVVFFHAGYELFAGGYVGVDVFFVISGYLITSIIVKEMEQGAFTILSFYERRARRILPALFFVMLCCLPFAWLLMAPHQFKDFSQSLVATTLFSSNIFFFLETDYFNELSERAPLLHTWSLAVEEQFYIFFPPLIMVTWKFGIKRIFGMLVVMLLLSLAFSQWFSTQNPPANFYLLPSRIWELALGSLLALYPLSFSGGRKLTRAQTEVGGLLGFFMIGYSIFAYDANTPFPSVWALVPAVGTALIIACTNPETLVGKLLSLRILVGIGLISYSLYLWHQPLFAFARISTLGEVPDFTFFVLAIASFAMAYFSYRFVEFPFRARRRFTLRQIFQYAAVGFCFFPALGLWGHLNDGFLEYRLSRLDPGIREFVIDRESELAERRAVWRDVLATSEAPFDLADSRRRLLILGDSKSQDLYVVLRLEPNRFEQMQVRRIRLDDGCMQSLATPATGANGGRDCEHEIAELRESNLLEHADAVVLSNTWRLSSNAGVSEFADYLVNSGKQVFIVGTSNFNDLTSLSMLIAENEIIGDELQEFMFDNIRLDQRRAYLELQGQLAGRQNLVFLEKLALFCTLGLESCELFDAMGNPFIYDSGHVTVAGARFLSDKILEAGWFNQF